MEISCPKAAINVLLFKAVYKVYGSDEQTYMSHVFHCNLNLKEASECNREECEFFKRLMVS